MSMLQLRCAGSVGFLGLLVGSAWPLTACSAAGEQDERGPAQEGASDTLTGDDGDFEVPDTSHSAALTAECVEGSSCVTQVAVGQYNSCAVVNGAAWCWGYSVTDGWPVSYFTPVPVPQLDSNVDAIATGVSHRCAIVSGFVYCWGENFTGQLGIGSTTKSATPVPVGLAASSIGVSSWDSTCALSANSVYCWGANYYGQLGNGANSPSPVPSKVAGVKHARAVAVGSGHACALDKNGKVYCWGLNESGQLGNNKDGCSTVPTGPGCGPGCLSNVPVRVPGVNKASAITAGWYHTCALVQGAVYCWGSNWNGELGSGSTAQEVPVPVAVQGLPGPVTQISAGGNTTCALANGIPYCWGGNWRGQLGIGTYQDASLPVPVVGLGSPVTSLVAGGEEGCAVVGGEAYCWGSNGNGQVGSGSGALEVLSPAHVVF